MDKVTFDLPALLSLGMNHAIERAEKATSLEGLGNLVKPLADGLLTSLGVQAVEIDPILFMMGKVVVMGMDRQRKIDLANAKVQAEMGEGDGTRD